LGVACSAQPTGSGDRSWRKARERAMRSDKQQQPIPLII
jgi:hypothetical protein